MLALQFVPPVGRRSLEGACALLTCVLAVVMVLELSLSTRWLAVSTDLWIVASIVFPGVLALSVVIDAVAHLVRLGAAVVGADDRVRPGDTGLLRIGASLLLGWLGGYVLYLVVATLYVLTAPVGGVLLAPVVAVLYGSVLGALVLLHTVLSRLFPDTPVTKLRVPALE